MKLNFKHYFLFNFSQQPNEVGIFIPIYKGTVAKRSPLSFFQSSDQPVSGQIRIQT